MLIERPQRMIPTFEKITSEVLKYSDNIKTPHTPFLGYMNQMSKYIKDSLEYARFLNYVEEELPDFNPLNVKGEDGTPIIHSGLLEDTKQEHIHKYLSNLKYSFYGRAKEGNNIYLKYNGANVLTFIDSENGKNILETDDSEDYNENKIALANMRKRIPALLKSIHDKGKIYGISALSCARAMILIGEAKEYTAAQLLIRKIYLMDTYTGECTKVLQNNAGKFQAYFRGWLNGKDKDIAYYDLLEFIDIGNKVGINMATLNPVDYGEAYINSLVVDFITPNNELSIRCECLKKDYNMLYKHAIVNNVRESIDSISLSEYLKDDTDYSYLEENVSDLVRTCNLINSSPIYNLPSDKTCLITLRKVNGFILNRFWENGIFIKNRGMPLRIDVSKGTKNMYYKEAVLHISGMLVLITDCRDTLYYLPINIYLDYVNNIKSKNSVYTVKIVDDNYVKLEWGDWIKCIL